MKLRDQSNSDTLLIPISQNYQINVFTEIHRHILLEKKRMYRISNALPHINGYPFSLQCRNESVIKSIKNILRF